MKLPVLLIHGIAQRDESPYQSNAWGRVPDALRTAGATVAFANQDAFGSVSSCGKQIVRAIERVCADTGCTQLHVVAHSKGGLDAQAALRDTQATQRVLSLTTLSSPHRGLRFCDALSRSRLIIPRIVAPLVDGVARLWGDHAPCAKQVLADLTSSEAHDRQSQHAAHEAKGDEILTSVGFALPPPRGLARLMPAGAAVRACDGPNDGLIPLWSTEAGSWIVLQVTEAGFDHADACDLRKRDFALRGSDGRTYSSIVPFLVEHLASIEAKQGNSQPAA